MKPVFEAIDKSLSTSLKIVSYFPESSCESAGWHIHPEYELVYIKNGNGELKIDTKTVSYDDGVLVFLGGGIPHDDFGNSLNANNIEVVIQFDQQFVDEKLSIFPEFGSIRSLVAASNQVLIFSDPRKRLLANQFESLDHLSNEEKLITFLHILSQLSKSEDHHILFSEQRIPIKHNEVYRLEQIFEHINQNYGSKISVNELALSIGLTPNSFCRFFRKHTKNTFVDFLNSFRVSKATELMAQPNLTIAEIMYLTGFSDPSYFSRQFKRYVGKTPSEFKKKAIV